MTSNIESKRINWIDNGKAIAVLLVGLGHYNCSGTLVKIIYTFHIPLFLFLSGITLKEDVSWKVFIKKRVKSLLLPYIFYSLLLELFRGLITYKLDLMKHIDVVHTFKCIFINWRGTYSPYYWYIPALFITEILIFFIIKNVRKVNYKLIIWLAMIGLQFLKSQIIGVYLLPWDIDIILEMGQYILLGNIIWKHYRHYFNKYVLESKFITIFIFIIGNVTLGVINSKVDLYFGEVGNYFIYIVSAYMGIVMICKLSYKINNSVLSYIGRNSLYFYILQEFTFSFATKILPFMSSTIIILRYISMVGVNIIGEAMVYIILKCKDKVKLLEKSTKMRR